MSYYKKRAWNCVLFIALKVLRKPESTPMNRQQTHAGNQRRNRLCHSCTFLKISQVLRCKNEAHASYNANKMRCHIAMPQHDTNISTYPKK